MSALVRRSEALRNDERWRPPSFANVPCVRDNLVSGLRRVFDLEAASIWRDLKSPLGDTAGTVLDVGAGAQPYRPLMNRGATYRAIDTADARERFRPPCACSCDRSGKCDPARPKCRRND